MVGEGSSDMEEVAPFTVCRVAQSFLRQASRLQAEPSVFFSSWQNHRGMSRPLAVFPALQGELCLKKFQSAKVRLSTMDTQNEIALYKKYRCNKMEIHLFQHGKCPEDF